MRLFRPGDGPSWLGPVLDSIEAAFRTIWPAPLRLKDYVTADLPPAGVTGKASNVQGLLYNSTTLRVAYSNGTNWIELQPYDATLAALAAYNTNGLLTQTAADTFTGRTITGTANEITVANGSGVAGNPTLSLPSTLTFTGKTINGGTFAGIAGLTIQNDISQGLIIPRYSGGLPNSYVTADASSSALLLRSPSATALISVADASIFATGAPLRCDSLRIDATATAATPTPTHTVPISINGTTYRFPCVI